MPGFITFVCGFIVFVISTSSVQPADITDITRLRSTILRNYDNQTRPVQSHQDEIHVTMSFHYMGFEFDEQKGVMTLFLQTVLSWKDEHVTWDPQDYGNLSDITFTETELWRPDISVINNYDESEIDHFGNVLILASHDSSLWWCPPTKFQVGCGSDFRLWPYDRQTCKIYVSSWSHHGSELNMSIAENYTQLSEDYLNGTENREWKIAKSLVQRSSQVVYCCPQISFVNLLITVDLERRFSTHTAAVSVVGLGIAIAILISFWLDPFANERIPLTLLVMLLNAIYLQNMHRTIPNNGATVPLAICFFRDSLIMVTFAFGWTVLIRYLAKTKQNSPVSLPDPVEKLLNSFLATILCLNPRPQSKGQSEKSCGETNEDGDVSELVREDGSGHKEDWEWLARLLDRIAFVAYFIVYTIFISAFL